MPYMLPLPTMQAPPPPQSKGSKPHPQQQMMRTVSISILVMSLPVLYVSFLHVPPAALFRDTTFWFLMSNSIIIVIAADSGMLFFRSSSSSSVDDGAFVVSGGGGGDLAAVKNGHLVVTGVSVENQVMVLPVENQVMVLKEEEHATTIDHAYALVLRDDHAERVATEPVPETRDIMVVTSPPSSVDIAGRAMVRADRPAGPSTTGSSRSPARREQRLRRRHSHRPSSHSHAIVPVQDKSMVVAEKKQLRRSVTEGRAAVAVVEEERDASEYARLSDEELNRRVEEFITKFNMEMRLQQEREQQLALAAA